MNVTVLKITPASHAGCLGKGISMKSMSREVKYGFSLKDRNSHRKVLIAGACLAASRLARQNRFVTSTDVLADMAKSGFNFGDIDRRFMGAVFIKKLGWKRVGFTNTGSHHRPVSVWERA